MRLSALARLGFRDLRGGLAGLRIFLACIAIGVAAIVGVNSLARSLQDGLAREGRKLAGVILSRNRWVLIKPRMTEIVAVIHSAMPGTYSVVEIPIR